MSNSRRKGKEFSPATKARAYERCAGKCEACGAVLRPGKFNYDHVKSIGLGGDNSLENCEVICSPCHAAKTHGHDNPAMAKADAQRKAHIGATRQKQPIKSRGFPPTEKRKGGIDKNALPPLPRRQLYEDK